MRLSVFGSNKEYAEYMMEQARAIENNGLRIAVQNLNNAKQGWGRDDFIRFNHISSENADKEWAQHIDWLEGQVKYLKRKIKTIRNKAEKALKA